jgi:hypothetical protein
LFFLAPAQLVQMLRHVAQLENEVVQNCHQHQLQQQDPTTLSVLLSQPLHASMAHSTGPGNLPGLPPGRLKRYKWQYYITIPSFLF